MNINDNTRTYSCKTVTKVPATNKMSLTKNRLPNYYYHNAKNVLNLHIICINERN